MEKWIVRLEAEERSRLEHLVRTGKAAAYKIRHANVLLAVDESDAGPGLPDAQVAGVLGVAVRSIESLRRRWTRERNRGIWRSVHTSCARATGTRE